MHDPTHDALRISWIAIIWSAISGTLAIAYGAQAASLALVGTGADIVLDLASSAVLVWRFRHPHGHEIAERRAHLVAASCLVSLGLVLGVAGVVRLRTHGSADPQVASIAIAAASAIGLPLLAARKYAVARAASSRALRTDAHITVVGASTAALSLLSLALTHWGIHSADAMAALVIAGLAATTGIVELVQGC